MTGALLLLALLQGEVTIFGRIVTEDNQNYPEPVQIALDCGGGSGLNKAWHFGGEYRFRVPSNAPLSMRAADLGRCRIVVELDNRKTIIKPVEAGDRPWEAGQPPIVIRSSESGKVISVKMLQAPVKAKEELRDARQALAEKNQNAARRHFAKVAELAPGVWADVHLALSIFAYNDGNYAEAEKQADLGLGCEGADRFPRLKDMKSLARKATGSSRP
jgi:hypothetical protein